MIRLLVASLTLLLVTPVATAQDLSPENALPPTTALEGDWTLQASSITPSDPSAIAELYSGIYLGPEGSRATVLLGRIPEGPAAARTSWDLFGSSFDSKRSAFNADFGSERDLAEQPVVPGCADMRRTTGVDEAIPSMAVGVSLCAADPDVIVLVYVNGAVNGHTGYQASDALVALAIGQSAEATPTAP